MEQRRSRHQQLRFHRADRLSRDEAVREIGDTAGQGLLGGCSGGGGKREGKKTKLQTSTFREIPNPKPRAPKNLKFQIPKSRASPGFGIWSLEFGFWSFPQVAQSRLISLKVCSNWRRKASRSASEAWRGTRIGFS